MNNRRPGIPMAIPNLGRQQAEIDIKQDTIQTLCVCGHELFDIAYRYVVLPSVSPKNPTGKDFPIKVEVYLCRKCGTELGKDAEIG